MILTLCNRLCFGCDNGGLPLPLARFVRSSSQGNRPFSIIFVRGTLTFAPLLRCYWWNKKIEFRHLFSYSYQCTTLASRRKSFCIK
jgi:hypothetical protein